MCLSLIVERVLSSTLCTTSRTLSAQEKGVMKRKHFALPHEKWLTCPKLQNQLVEKQKNSHMHALTYSQDSILALPSSSLTISKDYIVGNVESKKIVSEDFTK